MRQTAVCQYGAVGLGFTWNRPSPAPPRPLAPGCQAGRVRGPRGSRGQNRPSGGASAFGNLPVAASAAGNRPSGAVTSAEAAPNRGWAGTMHDVARPSPQRRGTAWKMGRKTVMERRYGYIGGTAPGKVRLRDRVQRGTRRLAALVREMAGERRPGLRWAHTGWRNRGAARGYRCGSAVRGGVPVGGGSSRPPWRHRPCQRHRALPGPVGRGTRVVRGRRPEWGGGCGGGVVLMGQGAAPSARLGGGRQMTPGWGRESGVSQRAGDAWSTRRLWGRNRGEVGGRASRR